MFTTFRGNAAEDTAPSKAAKPKRAQVRRACDACRLARAKCDLTRPCRNCKQSGRECVSEGANEFKGLASATREIERLRQRVKDLEASQSQSDDNRPSSTALETPPESVSQCSISKCPQSQIQSHLPTRPAWNWTGIAINGLQYGPLSLRFLTRRMSSFLKMDVDVPPPPTEVLSVQNVDFRGCALDRHQQDYFMDLFWLAYHINFPVLDEHQFGSLYASLWDAEGITRKPHALVDIVLALNIQYAFSFMGQDDPTSQECHEKETCEMSVAGSPFYHRCQSQLDHLMEQPCMATVQCLFFSATYLSNARCYNAAHTTLRRASHIASTLAVAESSQTLKLQLLRCIRTLDVRLCVKLGRFSPERVMPVDQEALPSSTNTSAAVSTANSLSDLDINPDPDWHVYYRQLLRLCETTEDIFKSFMDDANPLLASNASSFYTHPPTRDAAAVIMTRHLSKLHAWSAQVPLALQIPRSSISPSSSPQPSSSTGTGAAFTTTRAPLLFPASDAPWLHRQRLVLEAQYHESSLCLMRMFINFLPPPPSLFVAGTERSSTTLSADSLCIRAVHHALALTRLIAQAMRETDILKGCYQAFDWQQAAAYTLAAFAVAYPVCPPTGDARAALKEARTVFENFGTGNAAAVRMGTLCAELDVVIDARIARFRGAGPGAGPTPSPGTNSGSGPSPAMNTQTDETKATRGTPQVEFPGRHVNDESFGGPLWDASWSESNLWDMGQGPNGAEDWGSFFQDFGSGNIV